MIRKLFAGAFALVAATCAFSPSAAANLGLKDVNGTTQYLCEKTASDGSFISCQSVVDTTLTQIDPATKQLQQSEISILSGLGTSSSPLYVTNANGPTAAAQTTGNASLAAIAGYTKPATSFGAVTVGAAFTPGIGLAAICTAAGNVVLNGSDGSAITVPVNIGFNQFGFGVAKVASQTATCTFTNLL